MAVDGSRVQSRAFGRWHSTAFDCLRVLSILLLAASAATASAGSATSGRFRLETRETFGGRLACGLTPVAATADGATTGVVSVAGVGVIGPLWDTAARPDGWHDLTLAGVTNGATARLAALNGPGAVVREGTLTNDATWSSNAVQVVRHWVVVPAGRTLTLAGAVVKFCDGTGIRIDAGGTLNAVGAILTHVADDTAGGDTNMDGAQTAPEADQWAISGTGTVNLDAATEERWRTQAVTSGTISSSQTWRGSRVYLVSGDLTVASGATLTVQPGAVVKFAAGVSLIVNSGGTLNALGNRAQPITFTSYRDDAFGGDTNGDGASSEAQPGDWVKLGVNGGVARMESVSLLYSSKNSTTGAINMNGGSVTFVNGIIAHGLYDAVGVESGNFHMTNSVIRDCLLAFRHWPRDPIVNCVVYDCGRITQGGGQNFVNCAFVNIAEVYEAFGWSSTYRYCVFYNPPGYGPQSAQPVGSNGNRWADPLFADAANGDYRLLAGSPCIDAGDGAAAPERDFFGQPRMDVRGVPDTGVATTNGVCPDIGIYEYPGVGGGAAPDLRVVGVSAPADALVGGVLAVQWSVANAGGAAAEGAWRDTVSLVAEDGVGGVELGTFVSSGALAPGATNAFTASFTVPPSAEGVWRVRVQANAYRDVYEGTLTSNNVLAATATTTVSVHASDPAAGVAGTVRVGSPYATSVTFDGAHSRVGRIQAPAGTVVYYGIGFMPTESAYSGRAVCDAGGGVIGLPATDQRIYLLVVSEATTPQAFTLTFESGELVVRGVSPGTVPRSGMTSLRVTGANFAGGCGVTLVHGAQAVAATNVTVRSGEEITAEVDCARLTAGARYGVRVTSGTNVAELADALTVQAALGKAELACSLTVPDSVREGRTFLLYVNYENKGNLDMPAPVFTVQAAGLTFTVDGNTYSNSVKVLGLSATAPVGTLRPGEPQRLAVQAQVRPGTRSVSYELLKEHAGTAASKAKLPLALFFSEDWIYEHDAADDALIAALQARLGATWEEFYGNLGAYATSMSEYEAEMHDYEKLVRRFSLSCLHEAKASLAAAPSGMTPVAQEIKFEENPFAGVPVRMNAASSSLCECGNGEALIGVANHAGNAELRGDNSSSGDIWILVADGVHLFNPVWHRLVAQDGAVSAAFNPGNRTVLICHGNANSVHTPWVWLLAWAWRNREPGSNVLAVDWGDNATGFGSASAVGPAMAIPQVSKRASDLLKKANADAKSMVIVGHSHGGHVGGNIAKRLGHVSRLIGLDTSNLSVHLVSDAEKFPNSWNKSVADQVEFYKSSYNLSMGTGLNDRDYQVYGGYNFIVVGENDSFSYKPTLLEMGRHGLVIDWFHDTVSDVAAYPDLGYGWKGQSSWRAHGLSSGDSDSYENQYHGVINVGRKKIELAKTDDTMEWQYPEDILIGAPRSAWGLGRAGALDRLQQNVTRAVEYRIGQLAVPGTMRTGEDVQISFGCANEADNFSIDFDDVAKLYGTAVNDSGGPWTQGMTDGVWLCRKADGSGLGEQMSLIDLVGSGYEWTPVNTWAINNLKKFNRPGWQRSEPRTLTLPTTYGGQKLTEPTEFWLVAGTAMHLQEDQKPWAYLGDLCPTNNYLIQKVTIDPGSNGVARIAVNGAAVSDGERSAVVYVAANGMSASIALSGSGSEKGASEIKTYRWSVSDGTLGSPSGVSSSLTVPMPAGTDQKLVTVTLTITDMNGLTDSAEVTVPVRRIPEEPEKETGDKDRSDVPQSCDPNEVSGPLGFGDPETQRFVTPGQWLEYTVYFENLSNATASAQEVFVTNPLSEHLDWETFEMGEVAFHNQIDMGLVGKRNGRSEAALEGTNFHVRTEVAVDTDAGVVSWYLRIVDPDTVDSWPADPFAGFLPPNDETHRGEGHLSYRVRVREDAAGFAVISNAATIVFDYNAPITTDPSWWNTVAVPATVSFSGAEGVTNVTLVAGLPYGDLPTPTWAGYTFGGWWTGPDGAGTRVTANALVPEGDLTLYALWRAAPILNPPSGGAALTTVGSYDGFFHGEGDFNGSPATAVRGTLNVKVTKALGALTAKAVLQRGSLSFSAKTWTATEADGTLRAALTGKGGETLDLYVRQDRVWGTLSGGAVGGRLELDGARNRFAEKGDAAAQALLNRYLGYYTVALPAYDALSLGAAGAAPQGVGYLAVTVGKGGSAKIAGVLSDGTKVAQSSRLVLFGEDGACVPFFAPLYGKQGWAGGLLWVAPDRGAVVTDRDLGWFVRWENPGKGPDGFRELLDACGGYYSGTPSLAAHYLFGAEAGEAVFRHAGGAEEPAVFPDGVSVTAAGMRMTMEKGTKPTKVSGDGGVWYEYAGANPASATLTFAAGTGLLKGKFSLYYDYELNGVPQHKAVSVPYAGVLAPVRDAAFGGLPAGLGHCLVPESDPALKAYKIKRSYPVWLEAD